MKRIIFKKKKFQIFFIQMKIQKSKKSISSENELFETKFISNSWKINVLEIQKMSSIKIQDLSPDENMREIVEENSRK
jgi:hypothetical protein